MPRLSEYKTAPPNSQVSSTCSNWVGSFILVRPVRFERMAFGVGAVLCEVFASQRLLKRRSSPTFCVVFVCFLHLLGLPIFGGSSLVVAALALAIFRPAAESLRPAGGIRSAPRGRTAPAGCNPVLSARYSTHDSILLCGCHLPQRDQCRFSSIP